MCIRSRSASASSPSRRAGWRVVQTFPNRKANLVCESYTPYNEQACAASAPPVVNFSEYSIVGLLLNPVSYFVAPTPMRVFVDEDARLLVVEYEYGTSLKAPFYYVTGTRFFLVPRTDAQLNARAKKV